MRTEVENLVIGAGPAGYVCAIRLAQLNHEVVLIEKDKVGGVCLNRGCIPTKTLVYYTNIIENAQKLKEYGIEFSLSNLNWEKFIKHVESIPQRLRKGIEYLLKKNNVKLITGEAEFVDPKNIIVKNNTESYYFTAKRVIVATGSVNAHPSHIVPDGNRIITSDEALTLTKIPKSLIVIGGGVIGVEFASIYNKLGTKIVIIELQPQILPGTDKEIATVFTNCLKKQGIEVICNAVVQKITYHNENAVVLVKSNDKEYTFTAEKILVATGRKANLDNLNITSLGIELTDNGFIKVDDNLKTNINEIYAIGDIIGPPLLAHKAMAQAVSLAEFIAQVISKPMVTTIPLCIYTDPEIALVGLSEAEAQRLNYDFEVAKVPLVAIGRAHTMNKIEGMAKLVVDKKSQVILGAQLICPEASLLINELTLAINLNLPIDKIIELVHPHPTLSEVISEAAALIRKKAIHVVN
ncbi:MAG: dihydrolipoyl dehydrogenase [candidate division WOR-3 bacterium]|nr:dihydrolipoyl dehydrogenase [candidate division WOR-3 bacterium]MCX7757202.1 dihydrolipoyl dehydrogenase [candidate division WOR-3 bacterium]MDW7987928.1 dihydrolipoyl dehydrogenase [candidate division WOR-3 bacterium]